MKINLKHFPVSSKPLVGVLPVVGTSESFIVDSNLLVELRKFTWYYVIGVGHARATVDAGKPRITLHRYVAKLCGKKWRQICFNSSKSYDCRIKNLRAYDPCKDGAERKMFAGKKVPFKGVTYKSSSKKYQASIRRNKVLEHLGYFDTPEDAYEAYLKAKRKKFNAKLLWM